MIDWTYMPHIYFFSGAFSSLQSVLLYLITMIRFPIDATLRFCEYVTMALTDIFFFIASIWALSITFNIPNTADRMPIILSFIVYVIQFDIMLCYDAHTSFARQTDELSQFLFLSLSLYLSCVCVCACIIGLVFTVLLNSSYAKSFFFKFKQIKRMSFRNVNETSSSMLETVPYMWHIMAWFAFFLLLSHELLVLPGCNSNHERSILFLSFSRSQPANVIDAHKYTYSHFSFATERIKLKVNDGQWMACKRARNNGTVMLTKAHRKIISSSSSNSSQRKSGKIENCVNFVNRFCTWVTCSEIRLTRLSLLPSTLSLSLSSSSLPHSTHTQPFKS